MSICLHEYMCVVPEGGVRSVELELKMAVCYHVDTRN